MIEELEIEVIKSFPYHKYCFKRIRKFPFIKLIEVNYKVPFFTPLIRKVPTSLKNEEGEQ